MKRLMLLVMAGLLWMTSAAALSLTGTLEGVCTYPSGKAPEEAAYVYRYQFPVFSEDCSDTINAVYTYEAEYIANFTTPVNGEMYGAGAEQYSTELTCTVTGLSEDYVSVQLLYTEVTGPEPTLHMAAHVFALTGSKAGTVISLPYCLGALKMDENDEWLIDRQTRKCDACVRRLVWEDLQERAARGLVTLYDDADEEFLEGCFYPEEDFFINDEGDFVFFLQPDSMCQAVDGIVTFTYSREDLLDEL